MKFVFKKTRPTIRPSSKIDYFITSNINYFIINVIKGKIIFLPNIIVYVKNGKVQLIDYPNFKIEHSISHFRETDKIPKDAIIEEYTWKYVNNNGTKDKRYKDNVKVAICRYCVLKLKLDSDIEEIMLSNYDVSN